jgi:flagellar biosynthetic protein FliR
MVVQPLTLRPEDVATWVGRVGWPLLRIGGFVLTAPIASEVTIPAPVKILLSLGLALIAAPWAQVPADLSLFSGGGAAAAVQEILIGVAIGMVVQLSFAAVELAGQTISMTMGLGFSTLVDPLRGANSTVLSQFLVMMATLAYLAVNGHLILIGALARSFQSLPVGGAHIGGGFFWSVAAWGARVFESGILIALPAIIALIIINMAFGVVTRAAPQLNLFGVGFPITMLAGYLVLIAGLDGVMSGVSGLIDSALMAVAELVSPPAGAH